MREPRKSVALKADDPIVTRALPKDTDLKAPAFLKALSPIEVTLFGIVIEVREELE